MILTVFVLAACHPAPAGDTSHSPTASETITPTIRSTDTPTPTSTETPTFTKTPTATPTEIAPASIFATDEDCQNLPENPWLGPYKDLKKRMEMEEQLLETIDKYPQYLNMIENIGSMNVYSSLSTHPVGNGWIIEMFLYPLPPEAFTNRWCLGEGGKWLPLAPWTGTIDEWKTMRKKYYLP